MATRKDSRTSSGYTAEDEKNAKRYGEQYRIISQNSMDRVNAGEKGVLMSEQEVKGFGKNAERIYKENLSTEKGREGNKEDMDYTQKTVNKILAAKRDKDNAEKDEKPKKPEMAKGGYVNCGASVPPAQKAKK